MNYALAILGLALFEAGFCGLLLLTARSSSLSSAAGEELES
jgi:hypothetical protein